MRNYLQCREPILLPLVTFWVVLSLFGCSCSPLEYKLNVTVSGLGSGLTLVLQNNGGLTLTITSNGSAGFQTPIKVRNTYNVTVLTQPTEQTCTVTNGPGTMDARPTNIIVTCTTNSYTVGGTVSGLTGTVTLQNNSGDDLAVSANGSFTFATSVDHGSAYAVTVLTNPVGQTCSVASGSGTINGANVTNVTVTCITIVANDFNGDGIADILVAARSEDSGGANAGAVYVFYGSASMASSIDASLADVKIIGEVGGDAFGYSVTSGDVNNDNISDIIVGANGEDSGGAFAGAVYIFYGSTSLASSIDASLADVKIIGEVGGDNLGYSVASGDVNNDNIPDIIVGAAYESSGGSSAGAVYILYGSASLASSIDASAADVKLIGEVTTDRLGWSVASRDVNNDGISDIIVGANGEDSGGDLAGAVYVFYGSASMASSIDASLADVKLIGEAADDYFGESVASGDVNNDDIPDIIVGAYRENSGGNNSGAVYVFYGSESLAASIDASLAGVKIIGEAANDAFGQSVASGDVNNDGFDDVIAGAQVEDSGGNNAGAAYVFYGSGSLASSIDASLANVKLIGEVANDRFGWSVASRDVNNNNIPDIIVGAFFESSGGATAGAVYVLYGSASLASSIDASLADVKLIGEAAGDQFGSDVK